MRGKIALPLTRSGDELSTAGVPGGSVLEPGGAGWLGVTPGGSAGGRTNGDPPPVDGPESAAEGTAVAAVAPGHGSVRNDPRASAVMPVPPPGDDAEAVRRRRLEAGERRA